MSAPLLLVLVGALRRRDAGSGRGLRAGRAGGRRERGSLLAVRAEPLTLRASCHERRVQVVIRSWWAVRSESGRRAAHVAGRSSREGPLSAEREFSYSASVDEAVVRSAEKTEKISHGRTLEVKTGVAAEADLSPLGQRGRVAITERMMDERVSDERLRRLRWTVESSRRGQRKRESAALVNRQADEARGTSTGCTILEERSRLARMERRAGKQRTGEVSAVRAHRGQTTAWASERPASMPRREEKQTCDRGLEPEGWKQTAVVVG